MMSRYKALDVREIVVTTDACLWYSESCNNTRGAIRIDELVQIVVIAEDENKQRKRFHFFRGHQEQVFGRTHYHGYRGDYDILVPGDMFEIVDTDTYTTVNILQEDVADE